MANCDRCRRLEEVWRWNAGWWLRSRKPPLCPKHAAERDATAIARKLRKNLKESVTNGT